MLRGFRTLQFFVQPGEAPAGGTGTPAGGNPPAGGLPNGAAPAGSGAPPAGAQNPPATPSAQALSIEQLQAQLAAKDAELAGLKGRFDGLVKLAGGKDPVAVFGELQTTVSQYKRAESIEAELGKQVSAIQAAGGLVDVSKARDLLGKLPGENIAENVTYAVGLFKGLQPSGGPSGQQAPPVTGTPLAPKGAAPASGAPRAKDLIELRKANPEAFNARLAEMRESNPFFKKP